MKIEDIAGKRIRISASTITVLSAAGKTAGMVTGVETFYKMQPRDRFEFFSKAKQAGITNWSRLFRINGVWYFIADDAARERANEYKRIDGPKPLERLDRDEAAAVAFGAIVIHVERVDDSRK